MAKAEDSSLENLDNQLNRWENAAPGVKRSQLSGLAGEEPKDWASEPVAELKFMRLATLKNVLTVAVFFFIAMAGVVGWVIYRGENAVSVGNVLLEVEGPRTVKAGQESVLNLTLANQNNVPLEFVDLIIEYPPGARPVEVTDDSQTSRQRFSLGTVNSGETRKQTVKFVMFGEEGLSANFKVVIEYRLKDSNAIFDKTISYPLEVTDAPITLTLVAPDEVNAGQEISLEVELVSDSRSQMESTILLLRYPAGFEFKRATPPPVSGNNSRWDFDELKPGDKKRIVVSGVMNAGDNEEKAFRAEVGADYQSAKDRLDLIYATSLKMVAIKKSYVNLTAAINGRSEAEYVGNNRQDFRLEIGWANGLTEPIVDGEVTISIDGEAINRNSLNASQGFYRSSDNVVGWNKASLPALASLAAGGEGKATLSFSGASLLASGDRAALRNPEINLRIKFKGQRVLAEEDGKTQPIEAEITRKIKFNSVVQLAAQALHRTGPLTNDGPIPPQVGKRTTYTIVWSLANSSNNLDDARVQATLPIYVEWVGPAAGSTEPLEFVPAPGGGGEVIWKLGTVRPETGSKLPPREAVFQVALTPGLGQMGEVPVLLSAPTFSATDSFTRQKLSGDLKRALDTYLISEAGFELGEDRVVE